jgi:hypothetical protein
MNLYKKFHYNNISASIINYLEDNNHIYNNEIFYSSLNYFDFFKSFPEIFQFIKELKTNCVSVGIIKIFYNKVAIHQDNSALSGGSVRLNWPVLNFENSQTIFYENFNGIKEKKILDNGTIFHEYKDEDCREIDRVCVDSPTALNVGIPHRVLCDRFPRISLTFHLKPDPLWLLK